MNKGLIATLVGTVALVLILVVGYFIMGVSVSNEAARLEAQLKAQYDDNRNVYDNYFKKVKEIAQVPEMYVNDLQKVYKTAIGARYGADGSKAMFQFIREHNPNFDASMYTKIQQVIEAGRKDFEVAQRMLLDKKSIYLAKLEQFPWGFFARSYGWPKINLKEIDIVTSDRTEKVFETKRDNETIELRTSTK